MGFLAQRFERFMDFVVKGVPVSMNILLLNWVNWFREYKILRNCFLSFHLVYFLFHWRGIKDSSLLCTAFTGNNPWVRTIFSFFSRWIVRHVKNWRGQLCIGPCIEFIFYLLASYPFVSFWSSSPWSAPILLESRVHTCQDASVWNSENFFQDLFWQKTIESLLSAASQATEAI